MQRSRLEGLLIYLYLRVCLTIQVWHFKQLLNTESLLEPLLEQINHHLTQNSIIVQSTS